MVKPEQAEKVTELKESGIGWVGKMPSNWQVNKIKNLGTLHRGLSFSPQEITLDGTPVLTASNIKNALLDTKGAFYVSSEKARETMLKKGDVLVCSNNCPELVGKCAYIDLDNQYSFGSFMTAFRSSLGKYAYYMLCSDIFKYHLPLFTTTTISQLTFSLFYNMKVPLPPKEERERIVEFLDEKCVALDHLLYLLRQSITKVQEYRNAVVVEVIKSGLNSSVTTKDTGVEYIGAIPSHWKVVPTKHLFTQVKNKNVLNAEKNVLSLSYGNIIRRKRARNEGLTPKDYLGYNIIEPNDMVLRLTDLQNDKKSLRSALATEKGIITSAYVTIRGSGHVLPQYANFVFRALDICKVFYTMGYGIRQSASFEELGNLPFILPPYEEQVQIAKYLENKLLLADKQLSYLEEQQQKVEEYRASLISEAVTGKFVLPPLT